MHRARARRLGCCAHRQHPRKRRAAPGLSCFLASGGGLRLPQTVLQGSEGGLVIPWCCSKCVAVVLSVLASCCRLRMLVALARVLRTPGKFGLQQGGLVSPGAGLMAQHVSAKAHSLGAAEEAAPAWVWVWVCCIDAGFSPPCNPQCTQRNFQGGTCVDFCEHHQPGSKLRWWPGLSMKRDAAAKISRAVSPSRKHLGGGKRCSSCNFEFAAKPRHGFHAGASSFSAMQHRRPQAP